MAINILAIMFIHIFSREFAFTGKLPGYLLYKKVFINQKTLYVLQEVLKTLQETSH
jgi:hypothetical protein